MSQTAVQDFNKIRFGSGKVEVGNNIYSLINLGAMRNIEFKETWEETEVLSDNAGLITSGPRNQRASIAGDLMEIDLNNLNTIRGGFDVYAVTTGSPVSGAEQVISSGNWEFDKFIKITNQNHDKSQLTVNSVLGSTDGSLVLSTDYYLAKNEVGEWGIWISDSLNVTTENQTITINYDYTPAASEVLTSGGKTVINPRVVRITNTDQYGKIFRLTIYKAYNKEGITIPLPSDEEGEPAMVHINLEGTRDISRAVGDQLFEIYDEQGVA